MKAIKAMKNMKEYEKFAKVEQPAMKAMKRVKKYEAAWVHDLKTEAYINVEPEVTEILVKCWFNPARDGLEYRYFKSFRPQ